MTILEYLLVGFILFVIFAKYLWPRIYNSKTSRHLDYPTTENYHVVQLHKEKKNDFWFRIYPERKITKDGNNRLSLSKSQTYVLVLIMPNGKYDYTLMVNNCESQIPNDWRTFIEGFGLPTKGFPEMREMDNLYGYQARRRQQQGGRRSGYPNP